MRWFTEIALIRTKTAVAFGTMTGLAAAAALAEMVGAVVGGMWILSLIHI